MMIKFKNILYTANAHTAGGRDAGTSRISDGRLDVGLSNPGGAGEGTVEPANRLVEVHQ